MLARIVKTNGESRSLVGVPEITPVREFSVDQGGKAHATLNVGAGEPVAWNVKLPGVFSPKIVLLRLVKAGACWTVSVAVEEVAAEPIPLLTMT